MKNKKKKIDTKIDTMSNDYYHKTRKWLQNAIVDYIPSKDYIRSEIDIEMNIESIQRAIDALDIIFNPNLAVRSVESKNIVLGTINCIIDNSLLSDDQKIHYKETFSNECQLPLPKGRGLKLNNSHYWLLKSSFFLLQPSFY